MKTIIPFLLLILISACEKEQVETVVDEEPLPVIQECIIIGDSTSSNVHFVSYSPIEILEYSQNNLLTHDIDMNADGINDFQLSLDSYYAFAGTWFKGSWIMVRSLHDDAEISKDPLSPDPYANKYEANDSLEQQSIWSSDLLAISSNGDDFSDSCNAPNCPMISHGPWFGLSDQYIGVRMYQTSLGWIKISLPVTNPNSEQKLVIEGYASVP